MKNWVLVIARIREYTERGIWHFKILKKEFGRCVALVTDNSFKDFVDKVVKRFQ